MKYLLNKIIKVNNSIGKVISQLGSSGEVLVMDIDTFDFNKEVLSLNNLEVIPAREMTTAEFFDELSNNYFYDTTIQELKTLDSSNKTDKLMSLTLTEAIKRQVFLTDLNDFDYDAFFFPIIKDYRL